MKYYLNIKIAGEDSQVGVIDIGKLSYTRTQDQLKLLVAKKLIKACASHLDYTVDLKSITFRHLDSPISGSAVILVDTDGGVTEEIIELEQTWIY